MKPATALPKAREYFSRPDAKPLALPQVAELCQCSANYAKRCVMAVLRYEGLVLMRRCKGGNQAVYERAQA